jgi:hypothetical protein
MGVVIVFTQRYTYIAVGWGRYLPMVGSGSSHLLDTLKKYVVRFHCLPHQRISHYAGFFDFPYVHWVCEAESRTFILPIISKWVRSSPFTWPSPHGTEQ